MLGQSHYTPLKLSILASILCRLPFFVWVCPGAPYSSTYATWHFCLTCFLRYFVLGLGRGNPWVSTSFLWASLASRALSHSALPSRSLRRTRSAPLTSRVASLSWSLLTGLRILNFTVTWSLKPSWIMLYQPLETYTDVLLCAQSLPFIFTDRETSLKLPLSYRPSSACQNGVAVENKNKSLGWRLVLNSFLSPFIHTYLTGEVMTVCSGVH